MSEMTSTATQLRLPLATLPMSVLPGVTATIALEDADMRRALEAAAGGRLALRSPRPDDDSARTTPEIVVIGHTVKTIGGLGPASWRGDAVERARLERRRISSLARSTPMVGTCAST